MRVTDFAVRRPVVIDVAATIREASELLDAQGVGALIVVDHDRPVGIVTDRDIVTRAIAKGVEADARIDGIMTMGLHALDSHAELEDLMHVFTHHAVRRVPIVDHDRVVGVVSMDDLLVSVANNLNDLTNVMAAQIMFPHSGDEPPVPAVA